MKLKLYQVLARNVAAHRSTDNPDWAFEFKVRANAYAKEYLPSGSGWDCGTSIDWDRSTGDRLIFLGSFHHMDEWGRYDGWTDHEIWVRPSLEWGFAVDVKGRNRNDIKDYLGEMFVNAIDIEVDPFEFSGNGGAGQNPPAALGQHLRLDDVLRAAGISEVQDGDS